MSLYENLIVASEQHFHFDFCRGMESDGCLMHEDSIVASGLQERGAAKENIWVTMATNILANGQAMNEMALAHSRALEGREATMASGLMGSAMARESLFLTTVMCMREASSATSCTDTAS